ncbi:hypothetical protein [uncultured Litoreibacter sp.]|uniref:hypothetical protein n=1 Tax=uncultured Litoreibacter sp. TaxID=1392394 RepID=UPI002632974C|nr:hypothetical protein [uncultured Litoreibacter sp.]
MRAVFAVALLLAVSACSGSSGLDREALRAIDDIPEGRGLLSGASGEFSRKF